MNNSVLSSEQYYFVHDFHSGQIESNFEEY